MVIHGDKRNVMWRLNGYASAKIGFDTRPARALVTNVSSTWSTSHPEFIHCGIIYSDHVDLISDCREDRVD
jgi:hypothetical protein